MEIEANKKESRPNPGNERLLGAKRKILDKFLRGEIGETAESRAPIPRRPQGELAPLSYQQQQVWLHAQVAPDVPFYNETLTVCHRGPLRREVLERCLLEILRRHEIWRTSFDIGGAEPVQIVKPVPATFPLPFVDLRHLPFPERDPEARRLATEDAHLRFDLRQGPLLRARLVCIDKDEYRLYMAIHQIVFDAISAYRVFLPELASLYAAFSLDMPSPLPELSIQYGDFAYWQRKQEGPDVRSDHLGYWRKQLSGEFPLLEWPTDHSRPANETHRGEIREFTLATDLVGPLREFARKESASLYMTLLAGLAVVLYRYTGQEDFVLGSASGGRKYKQIEPMLGYFVNPLPLRLDLSGQPTFRELLRRVRGVVLDALSHDRAPYSQVVQEIQSKVDPSRNPLFQVMLSQQPGVSPVPEGWNAALGWISNGGSKMDLTVIVDEKGNDIVGPVTYNPDLFDASTISRLIDHWQTVLAGAIRDPEQRISDIPILTETERALILHHWNDTRVEYRADLCIHEFIEEQVRRSPEAPAIVFEGQSLSYRELNARANKLAHQLRKLGASADCLVAVFMDRSVEMVVALLGILKAGGAYVPLDPDHPRDRILMMIEDSQPKVLLTQKVLAERLPSIGIPVLLLDSEWQRLVNESDFNPVREIKPWNLCYAIYTSGSTGRPKGVLNTHAGIANRLLWMQDAYQLTSSDRVLQKTPFSFDVSVWEFFWPLMTGACLVVAKPGGHRDPDYLADLICRQQITTMHFVPSMLRAFLEVEGIEKCTTLKRVMCSGEALPFDVQEQFFARSRAELHNLYGPTEAAIDVTSWQCRPNSKDTNVPIGRPISNVSIYLLDRNLQPVPIGVAGELHIGGVALARGYLNRPELTAAKFIPDPNRAEPEARLYKTGDLARYRSDGSIEYLGRIDDQVKIRGFRIELGEIEAVLREHSGVRDACVIVREDLPGERRLVAYLVAASEKPAADDIRRRLDQKLPGYMIPALVFLDSMPLTPNGKLDRKALPTPAKEQDEIREQCVATANPNEELISGIWATALGLDKVGLNDDFFELGGHSLLAIHVTSRLREVVGAEIPVRVMFERPTVSALAAYVSTLNSAICQAPPISRLPRHIRGESGSLAQKSVFPASFAQQRLWYSCQVEESARTAYNLYAAFKIRGNLRTDLLEKAVNQVIERHESLRTSFRSAEDGSLVQVIADVESLKLKVLDLAANRQGADVERYAGEEARHSFDLAKSPLLHVALLRLAGEEHVLVITTHHIVSDGLSMEVFVRELIEFYDAAVNDRPLEIKDSEFDYADFAAWQRNWFQGEVRETQLTYWKKKLAGGPTLLELPSDRSHPAQQTFRGGMRSRSMSADLSARLRALAKGENVTLYMVMLSAFNALLRYYTGQDDVWVGSLITNRDRREFEGTIGLLINTIVLRTDLSGDPSFRQLLGRVRQVALEAYSHQDLPFEQLVEALRPDRDRSRSPLFQVYFAPQIAARSGLDSGALRLTPFEVHNGTTIFDLTFFFADAEKGIMVGIEYNSDLFDGATIERMLGHYQMMLTEWVANPALRMSELSPLTNAEREQILMCWNETAAEYPRNACVHELIEAQAIKTPEAVAVVFEQQRLSYRELNSRANQLANHLRGLGVGPEVLVGVCIERSMEMLIGLLGVLKAGGAYVPLDPTYPKDRLLFMVDDAGLKVLLTQESLKWIWSGLPLELICLDRDWPLIRSSERKDTSLSVRPENLAYVIYTSGSTGRPKGVQISHRAIVNFVCSIRSSPGIAAEDRLLAVTTISFDIAGLELYVPLSTGGRVVLASRLAAMYGPDLARLIADEDITVMQATPVTWRLLLESGWKGKTDLKILCGGEALPRDLADELLARGASVWNMYGPTETTIWSTVSRVEPRRAQITVGHPIANTEVYILDGNLQPLPVGVVGGLYIGGDGLARGYLNRPDLTSDRFVAHPFKAGERLYNTGDLARYRSDGAIECQGRADHQVKIRGYRIELGEIEVVLRQYDGIGDARVVVREDVPGDPRLVGYVVLTPGSTLQTSGAGNFLKEKLPDYMIPVLVVLDRLPLTPNGKLDARALPPPSPADSTIEESFEEPQDEVEKFLAEMWQQLLGVERVGVYDNFLDLGGHSLLAMQAVARIEKQLGVRIDVREFAFQTLGQLAAACKEQLRGEQLSHMRGTIF
jgi:amino acid adenylation domain-containing protein